MTRTTNTQICEDPSIETVVGSTVLIRQAQAEVGHNMANAISSGFHWLGEQGAKIRQTLAETTTTPTAAG